MQKGFRSLLLCLVSRYKSSSLGVDKEVVFVLFIEKLNSIICIFNRARLRRCNAHRARDMKKWFLIIFCCRMSTIVMVASWKRVVFYIWVNWIRIMAFNKLLLTKKKSDSGTKNSIWQAIARTIISKFLMPSTFVKPTAISTDIKLKKKRAGNSYRVWWNGVLL